MKKIPYIIYIIKGSKNKGLNSKVLIYVQIYKHKFRIVRNKNKINKCLDI